MSGGMSRSRRSCSAWTRAASRDCNAAAARCLIVLGKAVGTDQRRFDVGDAIGFRILDVEEVRAEDEERHDLALELRERRRGPLPARQRVYADDSGRPRAALQRQSAAKSLELGLLDVR